jgi:hypothetical protein
MTFAFTTPRRFNRRTGELAMTLEKVLYPTRVHITGGWKKVLMLHPLLRIVFISLLAAQVTPNTVWAQMKAAPPLSGVIGKVESVTDSSVEVQIPSGVVHVDVKQPLTTYKQIPSDLSHVTSTSYVGVASTEQADGKEVAKQIIIFPEELRGAAEGSVLTDPPGATTHSRMTNGSVSRPPVSHSRMTLAGTPTAWCWETPLERLRGSCSW